MNIAEDDDLATPLVAKVPVEVNPSTPPKSRRRTRFPPESVLCPAVFVPDVEAGVRIIFVVLIVFFIPIFIVKDRVISTSCNLCEKVHMMHMCQVIKFAWVD